MLKRLLPGILIGFLLLGTITSASNMEFYKRDVLIGDDEVEFKDTVLFENTPEEMQMPLLFDAEDLTSTSTLSSHQCSLLDRNYGSLLNCDFPRNESGRLTLRFKTQELIETVDNYYRFEDTLRVPEDTQKVVYTSKLKSGLVLIKQSKQVPFSPYSPLSGEKGSDGRRIFVFWEEDNLSGGDSLTVSMTFEEMSQNGDGVSSWRDVLIFGSGLIFIFAVLFLLRNRGLGGIGGGNRMEALKDDELEVMDIIESMGGEAKQKRVVDGTDFSKAKVSRLIKDLEERGMIEKEKVGRTNKIRKKDLEKEES